MANLAEHDISLADEQAFTENHPNAKARVHGISGRVWIEDEKTGNTYSGKFATAARAWANACKREQA